MNAALNAKFSAGKSTVYLMPTQELPYIALDPRPFEAAGISEAAAEAAFEAAEPAVVQSLGTLPRPLNTNSIPEATRSYLPSRQDAAPAIVFMRSHIELAKEKSLQRSSANW